MPVILVVDDEKDIRELVSEVIEENSWVAKTAATSDACLREIDANLPDLIILDIWLQGSEIDGLGVLEIVRAKYPFIPVIIISGHGNIDTAVKAIKLGAYDYLEKPFTEDKLVILVKRALELSRMKRDLFEYRLKARIGQEKKLLGSSAKIKSLVPLLDRIAQSHSRVLISGKPGSGKKFAAEFIHGHSKRSDGPFIEFDPTGLSDDEAKAKLFGNGFDREGRKIFGLLELANGGTLFIREISELSPVLQNKLLNFLQTQKFSPDGKSEVKVDVRIISSSTKDMNLEVEQKSFKQDLLYRLNVVQLPWPSLSDRIEDLAALAEYFVQEIGSIYGATAKKFSQEAILLMQCYSWPGNVRELKNAIEWTLIMMPQNKDVIDIDNLPADFRMPAEDNKKTFDITKLITMNLKEAREVFEAEYLKMQLIRFSGNITVTANNIGMERSALHRKLKLMQIASSA